MEQLTDEEYERIFGEPTGIRNLTPDEVNKKVAAKTSDKSMDSKINDFITENPELSELMRDLAVREKTDDLEQRKARKLNSIDLSVHKVNVIDLSKEPEKDKKDKEDKDMEGPLM